MAEGPRRPSWWGYLLVTALVAAPIAFGAGGAGVIASVIDRPIIVDCGGAEPAVCDEKWRDEWPSTGNIGDRGFVWEPVTYFKFEPQTPGGTCGAMLVEHVTFTFGLLGDYAIPLCP